MHTKLCVENVKHRDHLTNVSVDGKIISNHIIRGESGLQSPVSRQGPVTDSCVMNLWVTQKVGNFLTT
jgi:hypothetical protein